MNLAEVLNTIALLLPGYFGAWAMSFLLGIRKREWQQMVLYSLVFSALTYYVMLRGTPPLLYFLKTDVGIDLSGFQRALNEVSNIGNESNGLTFHNTVKVIVPALSIAVFLGALAGYFRRSRWFRDGILFWTGRTQNIDIWTDFYQRYDIGPHTIVLKNNNAYRGDIVMMSDTLTGNDRGIIVANSFFYENPMEAALNHKSPKAIQSQGTILIFADQIASISNCDIPVIVQRTLRLRKIARLRTQPTKFLRKTRVFLMRYTILRKIFR
jgi:hypothetical protein